MTFKSHGLAITLLVVAAFAATCNCSIYTTVHFSEAFEGKAKSENPSLNTLSADGHKRAITLVGVPHAYVRLTGEGTVHLSVSGSSQNANKISCVGSGATTSCDLWQGESQHVGSTNLKSIEFEVLPGSIATAEHLQVEIVGNTILSDNRHYQSNLNTRKSGAKPVYIRWKSENPSVWDDVRDHYELLDELGHGSFGIVYNARNRKTNELIALKQIKKRQVGQDSMENELTILNSLPIHPNICNYYGFYEDEEFLWIALQRCGNTSVRMYFNTIKANEFDARFIFKQVVSAILAMHNAGMYHRDLKPNNMQMTMPLMYIQMIDFGESVFSDEPRLDFKGAEGYSTPEAESDQEYTPSLMDVWVLGITLYRMKFVKKPFGRGWDKSYNDRVLELHYDFPEPVSAEFKDLIEGMLTLENRRMTLEQVANHPWMTMDD